MAGPFICGWIATSNLFMRGGSQVFTIQILTWTERIDESPLDPQVPERYAAGVAVRTIAESLALTGRLIYAWAPDIRPRYVPISEPQVDVAAY